MARLKRVHSNHGRGAVPGASIADAVTRSQSRGVDA